MIRTIEVKGHNCHIIENGEPRVLLFWLMGEHEKNTLFSLYENIRKMSGRKDWWLAACEIKDWNRELSPWKAPAVFENQPFAGGGTRTINWLTEACHILVSENAGEKKSAKVIGGYSLAGLFALWAYYESGLFDGAVSCSGSLWFPGWEEYLQSHETVENSLIYLSLGKKEEKTKNRVMAAIGDVTRRTYEIYERDPRLAGATLEWNEGNHFMEADVRTAKGFAWILNRLFLQ